MIDNKNSFKNTLHFYLEELKWSIIPVSQSSKIPVYRWKHLQQQRLSMDEALHLFKPTDNIALVCGPISNILVIDLDTSKSHYDKSFDSINSKLEVTTPSGGRHLYYRYSLHTKSFANNRLCVDIRSLGGLAQLPPSTRRGMVYTWNTQPNKKLLSELEEAPKDLLTKIYEKEIKPKVVFKYKSIDGNSPKEKARWIPIPTLLSNKKFIKKGDTPFCLCPFHDEKTGSFAYYPETNSWFCWGGCGGGDVFNFVQKLHGCDFKTAVFYLIGKGY